MRKALRHFQTHEESFINNKYSVQGCKKFTGDRVWPIITNKSKSAQSQKSCQKFHRNIIYFEARFILLCVTETQKVGYKIHDLTKHWITQEKWLSPTFFQHLPILWEQAKPLKK